MAPLRCAAKLHPFLSLDCDPPPTRRNPRQGRDQIVPSGNLAFERNSVVREARPRERSVVSVDAKMINATSDGGNISSSEAQDDYCMAQLMQGSIHI